MISSCNAGRVRKTDNVEASNADNTAVGENSRKVRNSHCISQIPICEKHSQIQGCYITAFTGHAGFERLFADENWKGGKPPQQFP